MTIWIFCFYFMFRSIHNSIFHSCRSNQYITAKQHAVAAPSRRVPYSHAHLTP
ncbi:hypothetical protein SXCC_01618 [Gluconacetobacter sp. SXCC-1]|nr:hypothetical protein SXCC_01618 [Gluconacetobacter sp. SXCC-1]